MGKPWEPRKLSQIVSFLDNQRIPISESERTKGEYPYYGATGIIDYINNYLFDDELILLSEDGANLLDRTYPICYLVKGKIWVNNHAHVLKPSSEINLSFLKDSLERLDYSTFNTGMAMPKLNRKACENIPLLIPSKEEQENIGTFFDQLDRFITLHEQQLNLLKEQKKGLLQKMFPKDGSSVPEIRFPNFTTPWEQRKFDELYERVNQKNDLSFGNEHIISVANMYFKKDTNVTDPTYLKTYNVFRLGDIAFEGNKSKNFSHGRFVENTIGDGIVSHVFDVFRPIGQYDLLFWKYLINNENVMGKILLRSTKASTMMTNLVANDFLKESIYVPSLPEQAKIGSLLNNLDILITLHQRQLDLLKKKKKGLLQKMFPKEGEDVPEVRFPEFK